MAKYAILYWQDIPSQVKAWDDFDEVKLQLDERYAARIDALAQKSGLTSTDDYLNQWNWGEENEIDGDPEDVAEKIKNELDAQFKS